MEINWQAKDNKITKQAFIQMVRKTRKSIKTNIWYKIKTYKKQGIKASERREESQDYSTEQNETIPHAW